MTIKTAEIFVFWVQRTVPNPIYALPLSSKLVKDHPILDRLCSANITIVDEETPLPKKQRFEFCTILVHEDPTVRYKGKIPIFSSAFSSHLVSEKLREDTTVQPLLNFRDKSISRIDANAVRVLSKLLIPRKHLYTAAAKDEDGEQVRDTLLNFAIDRKCLALCEIILKTKVKVNEEVCGANHGDHSALVRAVKTGSVKMVQLLLDHGADSNKGTVLCAAAQSGHLSVMKLFLKPGTRVKQRNPDTGNTALHHIRKPEMAKLLLASGARVNARNDKQETPLHCAVMFAEAEVVRVLLEHNAKIESIFKTEFEILCDDSIYGSWPQSNAVAVAACRETSTIFEMLIKFGATAKFEDLLNVPSRQDDLSAQNLSEKLDRYFDFTFEDFNDSDYYKSKVENRLHWILNTFDNYDICDFLSKADCLNLKLIAEKISVQIVKVEAAYDSCGPFIPKKISKGSKHREFKVRCKNEIKILKRKHVPGTSAPLYDILTGDPSFVSRFFRDESVARALSNDALFADFPIYGGVLKSRVSRGSWRRQVVNDGVKLCAALFPQFGSLMPWSVRERIANLLTNQEILVVEACFSRKQLKAVVGIPNCQILLDKL